MSDPTLFTTHVTQGIKRLLAQFQGQPNFEGQLRSYLLQVQELETVFFALMAERYLDTAVGAQLDGIGRIVGEPRGGANDADYRVAIKGRIQTNRANSRVEEIHALFVRLLPGFSFTWQSGTVASFIYEINEPLGVGDPSLASLDRQLQLVKGGGVHATLEYGESPLDESFTYASGDVPEASTTLGYGDDGQTTGGKYRDVV